jgi:hypothetical protein
VIRAQSNEGPEVADWALPSDEVGSAHVVIRLSDVVVEADDRRRAHCPVCGDEEPMQFVVTPEGVRYDHCSGCGLLWHVDHDLGVVVGSRLVAPERERQR